MMSWGTSSMEGLSRILVGRQLRPFQDSRRILRTPSSPSCFLDHLLTNQRVDRTRRRVRMTWGRRRLVDRIRLLGRRSAASMDRVGARDHGHCQVTVPTILLLLLRPTEETVAIPLHPHQQAEETRTFMSCIMMEGEHRSRFIRRMVQRWWSCRRDIWMICGMGHRREGGTVVAVAAVVVSTRWIGRRGSLGRCRENPEARGLVLGRDPDRGHDRTGLTDSDSDDFFQDPYSLLLWSHSFACWTVGTVLISSGFYFS